MKKLGLIATLGCALCISGVYATWVYGTKSAGSVSQSIIPQMAGEGEASKKGTINVDTTTLTMIIDDGGDYKPVLKIDGYVSVWFVPNSGASDEVKTNGIDMEYAISVTDPWKYSSDHVDDETHKDTPFFTIDSAGHEHDIVGGGLTTIQIPASEISACITLNVSEDFKLDTKEKFDLFQKQLNQDNSKFTFTVREAE